MPEYGSLAPQYVTDLSAGDQKGPPVAYRNPNVPQPKAEPAPSTFAMPKWLERWSQNRAMNDVETRASQAANRAKLGLSD